MTSNAEHRRPRRGALRAFTLAELLVVMGIIAILAALTVVAVGAIANDARLATGKNLVMTVLDNARSLAMRNSQIVLVVFRPVLIADNEQSVEIVVTEWSGESYQVYVEEGGRSYYDVVDRFRPIPDVPARRMPRGIKVAGAAYGASADSAEDFVWETQAHLPGINQTTPNDPLSEVPGRMIGIMYGSDGRALSRNVETDGHRMFVDFDDYDADRRRIQTISDQNGVKVEIDYEDPQEIRRGRPVVVIDDNANFSWGFFNHQYADDEPFVSIAPFLAVFDDAEARDLSVRTRDFQGQKVWNARQAFCSGREGYEELVGSECPASEYFLRGFISDRADRIHFNRYTGVIMR